VCPGLDVADVVTRGYATEDLFEGHTINAYIGRTFDEKIYSNAQSGGMVTEVLTYLLQQKLISSAIVVRMDYGIKPTPACYLAKNIDELYRSQKSIYTPIDLLSALSKLMSFEGDVALVGLPCHMQGIKSLINHASQKYTRVKYKLGLICDRALSYLASDYFSSFAHGKHKILYKDKNSPDYIHANVTLEDESGQKRIVPRQDRFLLKDLTTPPRCQLCFDKMNIHADLVFGDPWGLDGYDKVSGDSVVISRNETGQKLINGLMASQRIRLQAIDYKVVLNGQEIEKRKEQVKQAYSVYEKNGFMVPGYFSKFGSIRNTDNYKTERNILSFLDMEKNSREQNVEFITKRIRSIKKKEKFKLILKKVLNGLAIK
jgi:coenzyme F420 hydrogenase subunit beta